MALRSSQKGSQKTPEEIEELLESLEKLLDRTKVMFEQYFMGIQKIPPSQLHKDVERKIRELTQEQIRNTALRYRFTTISQKFGAYNSYWKRTLREIEQGRYIRDIARVKRRAERDGEEIPEEILAAMPKRMRDRIKRDRELLVGKVERAKRDTEQDTPETVQTRRAKVEATSEQELLEAVGWNLDAMFKQMMADSGDVDADDEDTHPIDVPVARAPVAAAGKPPARPSAMASPPVEPPRPPPARGTGAGPAAPPPSTSATQRAAAAPPPIPATARAGRPATPPPTPAPTPAQLPRMTARPAAAAAMRSTERGVAPAGSALPPGMSDDDSRRLYKRYVEARKLVGESVENLSYDKLMRTLSQQAPQIMREHNASGVDFNIVIKGNKVVLKARPKK